MAEEEGKQGLGFDPATIVNKEFAKEGAHFLLDGKNDGDGSVVHLSEAQLGVLQKLVTASKDDNDWRQVLLLTRFKNNRERQRAVSLIGWMLRHDVPLTLVVADWLARCAEGGGAREDAIQALTHMTLTTTSNQWNKRDGRNPRSPIR